MIILNLTTSKTRNGLNSIGKYIFCLAIMVLSFASCSDVQKQKRPERILSEDEMVEIYSDMMVLDAIKKSNTKIYKAYEIDVQKHIYNKYKIDSTLLKDNIDYYNLEFDANIRIFERVNENMNRKKEVFDSINKIQDSLNKIERERKRDSLKNSLKPGIVNEITQTN